MRWLFCCSATVVLAACGGAHGRDPFAYTQVSVKQQGVYARSSWATIRAFSFAGLDAYVVVPDAPGPHPAALFLHGSGGGRDDLIGQAAVLARHGFVTMTFRFPPESASYRPLVVAARRALDILSRRKDVDAKRLGVVGFSLGAQVAAILAGDDRRPTAVDMIGGRGNGVTTYWVHRAKASLLFQAGAHDEVVPHDQLLALMHAAPGRPAVRWYPVGHLLSKRIDEDLVAFMAHVLG
jgi:dienelactone hydrolase